MAGMAIPLIGGLLGGLFGRGSQNSQNEYIRRQAEQARADAERRRTEDIGRNAGYRTGEMDRIGGNRADARARMDPRIAEAEGDRQVDRDRGRAMTDRLFNQGGYNQEEAEGQFLRDDESAALDMTAEEQQNQFYGRDADALKFNADEAGRETYGAEGRGRLFRNAGEQAGMSYGERGEGLYDNADERAGQSVSASTRDIVGFSPEDQANLTAAATDGIGASAESAQAELLRRAAGRGNFAPGLNATMEEIARQRGRDASRASLDARIAGEGIQSGRELQLSDRERDAARGLAGRRTDALGRILDTDIAANRDNANFRTDTERDIQQQDIRGSGRVADRRMEADRAILDNRAAASRYNSEARRGANEARIGVRTGASRNIGDARIAQQNVGAGLQTGLTNEASGRETSRIGVGSNEDIAYSGQQGQAGLGYAGLQQDASNAASGAGDALAGAAGRNPTGMSAFTSAFTGMGGYSAPSGGGGSPSRSIGSVVPGIAGRPFPTGLSPTPNVAPASVGPRVQTFDASGPMPTMGAVTNPNAPGRSLSTAQAPQPTMGAVASPAIGRPTAQMQPQSIGSTGAIASPGAIGRPTAVTGRPQSIAGGTSPLMGGSFTPQPQMGRIDQGAAIGRRRRPVGPQMIGGAARRPQLSA